MQSKLFSLVETFTNIFVGWVIAMLTQIVVFPWFGINIPMTDNFKISAIFTVVAIIRGYALRRFFNKIVIRRMINKGVHS